MSKPEKRIAQRVDNAMDVLKRVNEAKGPTLPVAPWPSQAPALDRPLPAAPDIPAAPAVEKPKADKAPRSNKKTALEQVEGQQQELVAEALIATSKALKKAVGRLATVHASSIPPLVQSIARTAQAQADIAQMINAKPSQFKDPSAIEGRLRNALDKLHRPG